jgi:hypothetical protein
VEIVKYLRQVSYLLVLLSFSVDFLKVFMYPYRYTASPAYSVASSGVSTPAMTPPLIPPPMLDSMLANQPGWITNVNKESILMRISELQAQTAHLVGLLKQQQQPVYYPSFVSGGGYSPCPTPPVVSGVPHEAFLAAQAVFASVPRNNHLDESVLARAVVAAAQALVANKSGYIPNLRQHHEVIIPEAVRSQTPAWISQAAAASSANEDPIAPEFGSPRTVMKCARKTSEE